MVWSGSARLRVFASARLRQPGDLEDIRAIQARETPPLRKTSSPRGWGESPLFIPVVVCRTRGVACNRRYPGALAKYLRTEHTCRKFGNDKPRSMTIVICTCIHVKLVRWSPSRLCINGGLQINTKMLIIPLPLTYDHYIFPRTLSSPITLDLLHPSLYIFTFNFKPYQHLTISYINHINPINP